MAHKSSECDNKKYQKNVSFMHNGSKYYYTMKVSVRGLLEILDFKDFETIYGSVVNTKDVCSW